MKTFKIITIALIGTVSLGLNSCKKGEEDPFLSFKSRQNRIKGEWKMEDISGTAEYGDSEDELTDSYTYSYSEGMLTELDNNSGESYEFPFYWEFTFDKDGNFTRKIDESTENHEDYRLFKGGYSFMDKNKSAEIKKGQFLSLIINETVSVFGETESTEVVDASTDALRYELIRLTDDEMIIRWVDRAQYLVEVHTDNSENKGYTLLDLELRFSKK